MAILQLGLHIDAFLPPDLMAGQYMRKWTILYHKPRFQLCLYIFSGNDTSVSAAISHNIHSSFQYDTHYHFPVCQFILGKTPFCCEYKRTNVYNPTSEVVLCKNKQETLNLLEHSIIDSYPCEKKDSRK